MTLSSIIAIIATVLTTWLYGFIQLDFAPSQQDVDEASPKKRPWLRALHFFNMDEAPTWQKVLLKLLLSICFITALGCGCYNVFVSLETTVHIFWKSLATAIVGGFSWATIGLSAIFIMTPGEVLSYDLFGLWNIKFEFGKRNNYKWVQRTIIAINCAILCLWTTIFVIYLIFLPADIFILIGLSSMTTIIVGLLLLIVSAVIFKTAMIIFGCIYSYIKWLKK